MASHAAISATGLLDSIAGGKATIGRIAETSYPGVLEAASGEWLGLAVGAVFVIVAVVLPESLRGQASKPQDGAVHAAGD